MTTVFALTILLGAGLVFTVEPMFAKMLLPRAGGTPAVWNTCVLFFQSAMLAGYAYVHASTTWLTRRQQIALHLTLVAAAGASLPVAIPADSAPPPAHTPIPWLLLTLTVGIGAPFVMLASTAPLLQKWFADCRGRSDRDPYSLYAASNIGSLVALAAYPLVVEPAWTLRQQSIGWTAGYAVYGTLVLLCAAWARRSTSAATSPAAESSGRTAGAAEETVAWTQRARWLGLSLVPSSLLLGVTTHLSTEIAPVPLLWTVPLALYLLTFAIAFAARPPLPPRLVERAMPLLVTALVVPMAAGVNFTVVFIPAHLVVFFACALRLHVALAQQRPGTRYLTEFYLWMAAGGVLGGVLNTLVAPLLLDSVVEYQAALAASCLLAAWAKGASERGFRVNDVVLPALIGLGAVGGMWAVRIELLEWRALLVLLGALAFVAFSFSRRPLRFGLAVGAMLFASQLYPPKRDRVIAADRTFFGMLRVRQDDTGSRHLLMHGAILHGQQDRTPARRREPLSYYHRSGPIGQVMTGLEDRLAGGHIGVVGLGAGSMAAYAQAGQRWTFYEIDHSVLRIASDPAMFTYLDECGAICRVVLGDARLSLAQTIEAHRLLILDAFSSDAIPVHLMTDEALALYLARLEPGGILAFHISNRHLSLSPVLAALAARRGLASLTQLDGPSAHPGDEGHVPSEWFLIARDAEDFGPLADDRRWKPPAPSTHRIWTDDFSDILSVLTTN